MEPKRDADVERLLTAIDGVTDHEKHYEYRSTVLRLDSENRRLNELCAMYEADSVRIHGLLRDVYSHLSCAEYVNACWMLKGKVIADWIHEEIVDMTVATQQEETK